MSNLASAKSEPAAHALAMLVTACGRLDERVLGVLDQLQAFERLSIDRDRFVALARTCAHDVGVQLCECSWLRDHDLATVDTWLDAEVDPRRRMLICALAFVAISADGAVSDDERLVFEHALARWHVDMQSVRQICGDPDRASTSGALEA